MDASARARHRWNLLRQAVLTRPGLALHGKEQENVHKYTSIINTDVATNGERRVVDLSAIWRRANSDANCLQLLALPGFQVPLGQAGMLKYFAKANGIGDGDGKLSDEYESREKRNSSLASNPLWTQMQLATRLERLAGFDNTGDVRIWPAEELLAALIAHSGVDIMSKLLSRPNAIAAVVHAVELGAGSLGLAGLVLAEVWRRGFPEDALLKATGRRRVPALEMIVSDGHVPCVEALDEVRSSLASYVGGGSVRVGSTWLRWDDAKEYVRLSGRADIVLLADCCFNEQYHHDLLDALDHLLKFAEPGSVAPSGGALFLVPPRGGSLGRFLACLLSDASVAARWQLQRLCACETCTTAWREVMGSAEGLSKISHPVPIQSEWLQFCAAKYGALGRSQQCLVSTNELPLGFWVHRHPHDVQAARLGSITSSFLPPLTQISPDILGYAWLQQYGFAEYYQHSLIDFSERGRKSSHRDNLISRAERERLVRTSGARDAQDRHWHEFYRSNGDGAYSDRHWLLREFSPLSDLAASSCHSTVVEAGCGAGNTIWPLIEALPNAFFYGFDFAEAAIALVQAHPLYQARADPAIEQTRQRRQRCFAFVHDLAASPIPQHLISPASCDAATLIFVLGALPLKQQQQAAVEHVRRLLKPGGHLCVRDHAANDSSERRFEGDLVTKRRAGAFGCEQTAESTSTLRHANKIGEHCFVRSAARTIAYFFTTDALLALFPDEKWDVKSCEIVERETENRAEQVLLKRYFVQGVFLRK